MLFAEHRETDGGDFMARIDYTYEVHGQRLVESVTVGTDPAVVTRFAYHGGNVWADISIDPSPMITARRFFLDNFDSLIARVENGEVWWHLPDNLGSVRDVTDSDGTVVNHKDYDAFGNILNETGAAFGDRYGYTGREFSKVTGLQYNRARYYDPTIGRWTSEDPVHFAGDDTNLYRYVKNFPTGATDPLGQRLYLPIDNTVAQDGLDRLHGILRSAALTALGASAADRLPGLSAFSVVDPAFRDPRFGAAFFQVDGIQKIPNDILTGVQDFLDQYQFNNTASVFRTLIHAGTNHNPAVLIQPDPAVADGLTVHGARARTFSDDLADFRRRAGFTAQFIAQGAKKFAGDVVDFGQDMRKVWDLITDLGSKFTTQLSPDDIGFLVRAVITDATGFAERLLEGAAGGVKAFLAPANLQLKITSAANGWLFGNLKDPLDKLQTRINAIDFSPPFTIERVARMVLDFAGADEITPEFVGELVQDVTGLDVEDLQQYTQPVRDLFNGNLFDQLSQQLTSFSTVVESTLKGDAVSYAALTVGAKVAQKVALSLSAPVGTGAAALNSIVNGVSWLAQDDTKDQIGKVVDDLLGSVTDLARGPSTQIGNKVKAVLDTSIPLALGFMAAQFGLAGLRKGFQGLVNNLDLPALLSNSADMYGDTIRTSFTGLVKIGVLGGQPLTKKIGIGRARSGIWLRLSTNPGKPELAIFKHKIVDVLDAWENLVSFDRRALVAKLNGIVADHGEDLKTAQGKVSSTRKMKKGPAKTKAVDDARKGLERLQLQVEKILDQTARTLLEPLVTQVDAVPGDVLDPDPDPDARPSGEWGIFLFKQMKAQGHGKDVLGNPYPGPRISTHRTHAHHIVQRNGRAGAARAAVKQSKQILLDVANIRDPDHFFGNLIWAPNRGHTEFYATNVLNALKKADTETEVLETLKQQGRLFIRGDNTHKLLPAD